MLLTVFALGAIGNVALAVMMMRRKTLPAWPQLISPALVAAIACVAQIAASAKARKIVERIGDSEDESTRTRIMAYGSSESLTLLLIGATFAALLFLLAAASASVRSLSHGQAPRFGGGAIAALPTVGVASIVAFAVRPAIMVKLCDGLLFHFGRPPPFSVLVTLACAIIVTLTGIALSGSMRTDEGDARVSGDACATAASCLGAAVAAASLEMISAWRNGLGACSGASVDSLQLARILDESAHEARALLFGDLAIVVPIGLAFAAALLTRVSALGRGLGREWTGFVMCLIAVAACAIFPSPRASAAASTLQTMTALTWPKDIEAIYGDRHNDASNVGRPVLFVTPTNVVVDGVSAQVASAALTTDAECEKQTGRLTSKSKVLTPRSAFGGGVGVGVGGEAKPRTLFIAPDAKTPAAVLVCLARGASRALGGRSEDVVAFVLQVRVQDKVTSRVVTVSTTTVDILPSTGTGTGTGTAGDPSRIPELHAHVTKNGWRLRGLGTGITEGTGRISALPYRTLKTTTTSSATAPTRQPILITSDPDVPASSIVWIISAMTSGYVVVLGPADARAFDSIGTATSVATTSTPASARAIVIEGRVVTGNAPSTDLQAALDHEKAQIEACDPKSATEVRMTIDLAISADGVLRAKKPSSTPPPTEACVARAISSIKVTTVKKAKGKASVSVVFPAASAPAPAATPSPSDSAPRAR